MFSSTALERRLKTPGSIFAAQLLRRAWVYLLYCLREKVEPRSAFLRGVRTTRTERTIEEEEGRSSDIKGPILQNGPHCMWLMAEAVCPTTE